MDRTSTRQPEPAASGALGGQAKELVCLRSLNRSTRLALGALHGAPAGVAESAIAAFGHWTRVVLAEEGLIAPFEGELGPDTDRIKGRPSEMVVTPKGRLAMTACAAKWPGVTSAPLGRAQVGSRWR
jgi:hypothetical protein